MTVPSEDESRLRRAEVAAMLADTAQRTVGGQRWWQRFERDVELGGFKLSALAIAGWTIVGGDRRLARRRDLASSRSGACSPVSRRRS